MQNFQHPRRLLSTSINVKKVHKIENERRNVTLNEHLKNTNSSSRKFQVVEKCMSAYLFRNDLESFDHQYNLTSTLSINNASLQKQHYKLQVVQFPHLSFNTGSWTKWKQSLHVLCKQQNNSSYDYNLRMNGGSHGVLIGEHRKWSTFV